MRTMTAASTTATVITATAEIALLSVVHISWPVMRSRMNSTETPAARRIVSSAPINRMRLGMVSFHNQVRACVLADISSAAIRRPHTQEIAFRAGDGHEGAGCQMTDDLRPSVGGFVQRSARRTDLVLDRSRGEFSRQRGRGWRLGGGHDLFPDSFRCR